MTTPNHKIRLVMDLRRSGVTDTRVLSAIERTPREAFCPPQFLDRAYEDTALPIGFEQTISQPFVVARMIELIRAGRKLGRVLEVGTGCGYQAAVLAAIATEVYSIERITGLHEKARSNLRPMRISNLRLAHGDGSKGLPDVAPFDAIILAAAAPTLPETLPAQLAVGGRLIAPLGVKEQSLCLIERTNRGFVEQWLDPVRFVPLRGGKA